MARTNGGIIGVKNITSFGKNTQTVRTSSGNVCTQAGTRIVQVGIVAGGGSDTPTAPTGPDADSTGMTETTNASLRTFTLLPGEFAWFPWDYTGDIYHEAATGTPQLEYWRFDEA